jgi:DNA-binding FrmR family transcriptional regulator
MIAAGRPCTGIARQMRAVGPATGTATRMPIRDRMDRGLDAGSEADRAGRSAIARHP